MVKSAVALIEVCKLAAREITTFIAKADQPFPQQMAMVIHIGTVLATRRQPGQ
jgi:peptide subunit release factor RF-3